MIVTVSGDRNGTPRPKWPFVGRSITARVRFRMTSDPAPYNRNVDVPPGTTIKLIGMSDPLRGIGPLVRGDSVSHGCSDRLTARWHGNGVELRTYAYRNGKKVHSETLCVVPVSASDPAWTEWVTVEIGYLQIRTVMYHVDIDADLPDPDDAQVWCPILSPRRCPVQILEWSHGRNGAESPSLPVPVTYEIEVL